MRKSLFSAIAASVILAGAGIASAQTTSSSTTTWTTDQGNAITQYSTSQHYNSINDPSMNPTVGATLPSTVTVYPLPQTVNVPQSDEYGYTIINNNPVVVNRTTRTVVHTWGAPN